MNQSELYTKIWLFTACHFLLSLNWNLDEDKKPSESGVVYDSATLKMSVKDKISKFRTPGNESEAGKGRLLLQSEKKDHVVSRDSKKNDSLPVDTEEVSTKKSSSLSRDTTPADMKKGETTEGGFFLILPKKFKFVKCLML